MSESSGDKEFMERTDMRERLNRGEKLVLVDVRSSEEFASAHIDGAINIPANELAARIGELPCDVTIITVCNFGGARSCGAAEQLRSLGYRNALPLRGGIRAWQSDERGDGTK